jgi:hypothetical protein
MPHHPLIQRNAYSRSRPRNHAVNQQEGPMPDRSTTSRRFDSAGFTRTAGIALPIILFAAMLLFAILVSLRYANG